MAEEKEGNRISKQLKEFLAKLIAIPYRTENSDIVDIINDYPWINDKISKSSDNSISNKIPFCYVIERQSAANAGVANILNMLNSAIQNVDKIEDTTGKVTDVVTGGDSTIGNAFKEGLGKISTGAKGIINTMINALLSDKAKELIAANNLNNSTALAPYKYLYITKPTGKKYRFPLATETSSFSPLKNNWSNSDKLPGFLQKALDAGTDIMEGISKYVNFGANVADFQSGGGDTGTVKEMAKSFTPATQGDSITVSFTLYNTTRVNAWKDNYRFLFLFYLRNHAMRTDFASFVPPLLYDVLVPGIKQLPVCSVEQLQIKPKGMTRILSCENFLSSAANNKGNQLTVNVPEAWEVTITFRSLIAASMNLLIEGVYGGYKISTETSEEDINISVEDTENTKEPAANQ